MGLPRRVSQFTIIFVLVYADAPVRARASLPSFFDSAPRDYELLYFYRSAHRRLFPPLIYARTTSTYSVLTRTTYWPARCYGARYYCTVLGIAYYYRTCWALFVYVCKPHA